VVRREQSRGGQPVKMRVDIDRAVVEFCMGMFAAGPPGIDLFESQLPE